MSPVLRAENAGVTGVPLSIFGGVEHLRAILTAATNPQSSRTVKTTTTAISATLAIVFIASYKSRAIPTRASWDGPCERVPSAQ
jgi:hypothetical protein